LGEYFESIGEFGKIKDEMKLIFIYIVFTLLLLSGCSGEDMNHFERSDDTKTSEEYIQTAAETEEVSKYTDFINPYGNTVSERFIEPEGFKRVEAGEGSFADFLRKYPLEPEGAYVYYFDGRQKSGNGHAAVFTMEVSEEDLQQCADSIMRIYAEYLYKIGEPDKISFHFVDGFVCDFSHWSQGYRVKFSGETPRWEKVSEPDGGEESFKKYLRIVFAYSSTLSMEKEAKPIAISELLAGDIFIKAGSPGHVVMVTDVCENERGEKAFLLAQGFMPAQSFHIIKNPAHPNDPWYYENEVSYPFKTQNYSFPDGSLMRPVYLEE